MKKKTLCAAVVFSALAFSIVFTRTKPRPGVVWSRPDIVWPTATDNRRTSVVSNNLSIFDMLKADGYNPVNISVVGTRCNSTEIGDDASFVVPNVVHYVWLSDDLTFSFINHLSFRSADRFIRPDYIFIYGEEVPKGIWWDRLLTDVECIFHVHVDRPTTAPNGQTFRYMAHSSDFLRFNLMFKYGGIYLDSDVLVLKSFNPLRQYDMVLGREQPDALCNGIIIAKRGAKFLRLIIDQYQSYLGAKEDWGFRANRLPHHLAKEHPELIHIEEKSLNRPNWKESPLIYNDRYNWTSNFAMHLWVRKWPKQYRPNGPEDINAANTTLGEMSRLILYGSSQPTNRQLWPKSKQEK